mgnify:CR=1 FL=1
MKKIWYWLKHQSIGSFLFFAKTILDFKISSTFKPSVSALKFGKTLCLNTGSTKELTSSILGVGFPSNAAFAFAPKTKYWDALGPAPQSICCLMKSGDVWDWGLVAPTSFTTYSTTLSEIGIFLISFWNEIKWFQLI